MKKFIVLYCTIILMISNLFAQNNATRIGGDCIFDNSKILANILFSVDSSFIQKMYDENCKILFIAKIDSNGNLVHINKQRTIVLSSAALSNDFLQKVEDYIKVNKIPFYICYSHEPGLKMENIKKESFYWINVGIPGLFEFQQNLLHYMVSSKIIKELLSIFLITKKNKKTIFIEKCYQCLRSEQNNNEIKKFDKNSIKI